MPTERARKRAAADKRHGKSGSTQAGEYVREEMHKLKHGGGRAKNPKQAIAIGLSEARRDGVAMPGPRKGTKKAAAKKSGRKSTAKKSAGRKAAGRETSARKSTAHKSGGRKTAAKPRSPSKKSSRRSGAKSTKSSGK